MCSCHGAAPDFSQHGMTWQEVTALVHGSLGGCGIWAWLLQRGAEHCLQLWHVGCRALIYWDDAQHLCLAPAVPESLAKRVEELQGNRAQHKAPGMSMCHGTGAGLAHEVHACCRSEHMIILQCVVQKAGC